MSNSLPGQHVMHSRGVDDDEIERCQAQSASAGTLEISTDHDCWPCCIVWTWIPGCTQCSAGIIGHLGIATSKGQIWEFMGDGAQRGPAEGGLAFGPIIRYLPLNPRLVRRGTWDDGIEQTVKKWRGTMHGACVSNCHSFVADCLDEMRYAGVPCWTWLSYVLALWVWVCGRFASAFRFLYCCVPTVIIVGAIVYFTSLGGSSKDE